MRGATATLKCSVCEHVFRIESGHRLPAQENSSRWMVRNHQRGDVLYFPSFDVLHRWILDRKVSPQDELSRTGRKWTALAQIGEFAPIFQVVESISSLTPSSPVPPRQAAPTIQQFAQPRPAEPPPHSLPHSPPHSLPAPSRPASSSAPTPAPLPPQPAQPPAQPPTRRPTPQPPTPRQGTPTTHPRHTPTQGSPRPPAPSSTPAPTPQAIQARPPVQAPLLGEDLRDQWSIGHHQDVEDELPPSLSGAYPAQGRGGARGARLALVSGATVLLIAAGVTAWVKRDALQATLATSEASQAAESGQTALTQTAQGDADPRALAIAHASAQLVGGALDSAQRGAHEAGAGQLERGVAQAHQTLVASLAEAARASERASIPDAPQLIKRASRAFDKGGYEQARALYHQALTLDPRSSAAMTGLGWSLFMLGNTEAAIAQFNRAIHANAGYEDAYIGLGKAERSRGKLREALNAYESYLARFPSGSKASIARHQRDQLQQALGM